MKTDPQGRQLDVLLSPAEFERLRPSDLAGAVCVVFDVLRATTTMLTGLARGAECIVPVADLQEALAQHLRTPSALLAGERNGVRITAQLSGSVDFHLGNSPREFTSRKVRGKTIITTTTNGTRALRACAGAEAVLAAALVNLEATARWLRKRTPARLLLVAAGTFETVAFEDVLAAGALCQELRDLYPRPSDAAIIALNVYAAEGHDLYSALCRSLNGRRLLARPELRDDVRFCSRRNLYPFAALLGADGNVTRAPVSPRKGSPTAAP